MSAPFEGCREYDERMRLLSTRPLPLLELRCALLAERLDALAVVVGRAEHPVGEPLELEPDRERGVVDVVEDALGGAEGERRQPVEVGEHTVDGIVEPRGWDDLGDEPPGE